MVDSLLGGSSGLGGGLSGSLSLSARLSGGLSGGLGTLNGGSGSSLGTTGGLLHTHHLLLTLLMRTTSLNTAFASFSSSSTSLRHFIYYTNKKILFNLIKLV
jgi:hypothetical protein